VTYFELLGLSKKFELDVDELTRTYRAIARRIHPDHFADRSADDREIATKLSARLNQAYRVLRDPVSRADYVLTLSGGPSASEVRDVPGALLMEVMEIRERIEQAKLSNGMSDLDGLKSAITARRESTLAEIGTLCASLENATESARREIRKLLNSMKYFDNLLNELSGDPLAKTASPIGI